MKKYNLGAKENSIFETQYIEWFNLLVYTYLGLNILKSFFIIY